MKYVKMLGLVAVAAAALMAFVGATTASATVLCKTNPVAEKTGATCPEGWAYPAGTEIHEVNKGNVVLTTGSSSSEITCKRSTVSGKTTNEGSATATVSGTIENKNLTFENCATPSGACTVTTLKGGTLEVHWIEGAHSGTLTSSQAEVTSSCSTESGSIHCIYVTDNEDIGTLTGGKTSTVDIERTPIYQISTSPLCPLEARLDAKYEITAPKPLYVAGPGGQKAPSGGVFCKTEGTGSRTGTTCPVGESYPSGTQIHAVLDPETKAVLTTGSEFTEITCKTSTVFGKTENEGGIYSSVRGPIETLTFGECATPNGACTVTTLKGGTLDTHWIEGTHNGTLTSNNAEVTSSCASIFGNIHCIYKAAEGDVGKLTGGNPVTIDIESASINLVKTGSLCPAAPKWDAKYEITSPKPLYMAGHASEKAHPEGVLCKVEGTGSPTGTVCPVGEGYPAGTEIHAVLDPETTAILTTGSEFTEITCKTSTVSGKTQNEGSAFDAVRGSVEKLTFEACATPNGKCTVTTVESGMLEIGWIEGTHNGTLISTGTEITSSCASIFGNIHCIYVTSNQDLGTLTGGNPATLDIESTPINQISTSGLCPSAPTWDAKYEITSPKPLYVAAS